MTRDISVDPSEYMKGLETLLDEVKKKRAERRNLIEHKELIPKDTSVNDVMSEVWYYDGKLDGLNLALVLLIGKVSEGLEIVEDKACVRCGLPVDLCVCEENPLGR